MVLRAGAVQDPKNINLISDPKGFLGISDKFGFTKKNELFVGRVAMLGFAAELIGELAQGGKGPLGQLGACQRPCHVMSWLCFLSHCNCPYQGAICT